MVRGSSEIFKKLKAMAVLTAVLLSGMMMSSISSISTPTKGSSAVGGGNIGDSYADIGRPSFLEAGKYLNYSANFGVVPERVNQTTTNLTANLYYQFNTTAGPYYSIIEKTTNLHVSYGYTNPERVMGLYNTSATNVTRLAEQYRGYSDLGPIKASSLNLTNFNNNYSFTTTLNMYTSNGSFASALGNGTNQIIVDSKLSPSPARVYYFGYYRTILSYYKMLSTLYRAPKALYTPTMNFTIGGTETISTYLGTRSAVKLVRNTINVNPIFTGSIINLKWQDILYFDTYTGVLIKAIMYVDNSADGIRFHKLEFNLVSSNLDFGVPAPSPENEFEDAMNEIKDYLSSSALNDTNRSLFYHAAVGGSATPSNSTKFTADAFQIMTAYLPAFETELTTLFLETKSSILRDLVHGGFYHSMNAEGTVVDGVKTVTDAAWAIIGSSSLGSAAYNFQQEMFNYMVDYHYGTGNFSGHTFHAFARYNKTLDTVFYAQDNLIAYLALNTIAFFHNDSIIKAQAKAMAYQIISLFVPPNSNYPTFDQTLFVNSLNWAGEVAGTSKSVLDSLLAIFALCEYYAFNQTIAANPFVTVAMSTFKMLLAKAWNATNKGFIHELDFNLNPTDSNQYLLDNAWALSASLGLLESANKVYAKKNITYYDVACDTWTGIKNVLYDSQNKTYKAASNNPTSFTGDLGILLLSLSSMLATSRSTTLTVVTNSTTNTFLFENLKPIKATAKWSLNLTRDMPSPVADISTIIPLNYSDVYFMIRYSNETIYDEIFSVTDNTGAATFTFPIPTPPEFTETGTLTATQKSKTAHLIGVVANRTGFEAKEAFQEFYVTSGITVWTDPGNPTARFEFSGAKVSAYFNNRTIADAVPSIYPGENFTVSLNMSSTVTHAEPVNITFSGEIINRVSEVVIVNASAVNATYTLPLTAMGDIPTGMQTINYLISKNGSGISWGEIPVFVNIPVFLTNVNYSAYMVDNSIYSLTFNVKNLNKNRNESVTVVFSSVNLELVGGDATFNVTNIIPNKEVPISLSFQLKADAALLNRYQFTILLSWENVSLGTLVYSIPFRAAIEVFDISGPTKPVQGGMMLFAFSLRSNLVTTDNVTIMVMRVSNTGAVTLFSTSVFSLAPGRNNFIVSCKDPLDNPWDIGAREYRVVVLHGSVVVGRETVIAQVQLSIENAILGYVLVFGAFGVVFLLILNKKRQLDSVRR